MTGLVNRVSGQWVAIKQMRRIFDEPTDAKRAYREMHLLRHLKHPSVVALLDVVSSTIDDSFQQLLPAPVPTPTSTSSAARGATEGVSTGAGAGGMQIPRSLGDLYLVFEFMDTDLSKIIKSNQFLSMEHVQFILYQLLEGMSFVHDTNVIHR